MARAQQNRVVTFVGNTWETLTDRVVSYVANRTNELVTETEIRLMKFEERIMRQSLALLSLGVGGFMVILAAFFFLREYLALSAALSFLILAGVMLVAGSLLRLNERRLRRNAKKENW